MNFRNEQPHRFTEDPNRDAVPSSADTDSPLAAQRLSEAVDRITRKMDRIVVKKTPSDYSQGPLQLLGICIAVLAIIAVLGIIMRDRKATFNRLNSKQPEALQQHPGRQAVAPSLPRTTPLPAIPNHSDVAPAEEQYPDTPQSVSDDAAPSRPAVPPHPRTAPHPTPQVKKSSRPTGVKPAAAPALTSSDNDETDIDKSIAFYEPVNRQSKSGAFEVRSGNNGRNIYRTGPAATEQGTRKRSHVKATASLAARSGGTLDEVLEHNGNYYKIKLTIPGKRLESFKKSLAADDAIATLSVTTESTSGGASVIILEFHTR